MSSTQAPGNPFPLSPAASPSADPRMILEQLAATTQLLSNIVLNQQAQPPAKAAATASTVPTSGFSDANKILNRPETFGSLSHEADLAAWQDWMHSFKNWLTFADPEYEKLLQIEDQNLDTVIDVSKEGEDVKVRGAKLYAVLPSLLKHKPRTLLKQVEDRNGLEVWRQLQNTYAPKTRARSLAILNALTSAPNFTKDKTLQEQVLALERISAEYTRVSGRSVGDDIMLGTLVRCLPHNIRSHVQLVMTEKSSYEQVRSYVFAYEATTTSWSPQRVHQALGVIAPQVQNDNGPAPMEIDRVKGKGKGKGKDKGKGQGNDKGKGKGHGKTKGNDKGRGKGKGAQKGKGKSQGNVTSAQCLYCHKPGHWKRDCFKFQKDLAAGKVQAISDDTASQVSAVAPSQSASNVGTAASSSTAPQPKARVARVVDMTSIDESPEIEIQYLRMVLDNAVYHALTDADDEDAHDDAWSIILEYGVLDTPQPGALGVPPQASTGSGFTSLEDEALPSCDSSACMAACESHHESTSKSVHQQSSVVQGQVSLAGSELIVVESSSAIRALSHIPGEDIILDSGADVSALPASYANVGVAAGSPSERYVDASGRPLKTCGMRIAEVQVGAFRFKEKFLIGGVTCPLLSLGKMYKAGVYVIPGGDDGQFLLTNGVDSEPVKLKRHSLCAVGHVRVIDMSPQVRAIENVTLNEPLRMLDASGWQRAGSRCYALLSFGNAHVDTTLIPLSELLWYRTTLIRVDNQWILEEFAEDISGMADRTVQFEHAVEQVITIAHSDSTLSPQDLGFTTPAYAPSPALPSQVADVPSPGQAGAAQVPSAGQAGAAQVPSPGQAGAAQVPSPGQAGAAQMPSPGQAGAAQVPSAGQAGAAQVPSAGQDEPQADVAMQAPGGEHAEPMPEQRVAVDNITVDGVVITRASTLRLMRAACVVFGLSKNGSKAQCWDRLIRHLQEAELLRSHQVEHALKAEMARPPRHHRLLRHPLLRMSSSMSSLTSPFSHGVRHA